MYLTIISFIIVIQKHYNIQHYKIKQLGVLIYKNIILKELI